jgi:hypothetical protein
MPDEQDTVANVVVGCLDHVAPFQWAATLVPTASQSVGAVQETLLKVLLFAEGGAVTRDQADPLQDMAMGPPLLESPL